MVKKCPYQSTNVSPIKVTDNATLYSTYQPSLQVAMRKKMGLFFDPKLGLIAFVYNEIAHNTHTKTCSLKTNVTTPFSKLSYTKYADRSRSVELA